MWICDLGQVFFLLNVEIDVNFFCSGLFSIQDTEFNSTNGYDVLLKRMKEGREMCKDYEEFLKQRLVSLLSQHPDLSSYSWEKSSWSFDRQGCGFQNYGLMAIALASTVAYAMASTVGSSMASIMASSVASTDLFCSFCYGFFYSFCCGF